MARSYTVEADGAVIPFEAPENASAEQIRLLASRALKAAKPDRQYQRPVLEKRLVKLLNGPDLSQQAQGGISASPDTLESRINGGLAHALSFFGMDERGAQREANKATAALNDLTPVGSATLADDARRDFGEGRYLSAAGKGALAGLGLLPDGGALAAKGTGVLHSIIAPLFHGSPHKFEKFAWNDAIRGTGEGAQAYGDGLYFAENPEVARDYQRTLAAKGPDLLVNGQPTSRVDLMDSIAGQLAAKGIGQKDANYASAWLASKVRESGNQWRRNAVVFPGDYAAEAKQAAIDLFAPQKVTRNKGHLYEVSLDAEPHDFLDWDAPISQQPRAMEALRNLDLSHMKKGNRTRVMLERELAGEGQPEYPAKGMQLVSAIDRAALREGNVLAPHGFHGIRFFDQGSRGALEGTRNYVVFNPDIIDITGRY